MGQEIQVGLSFERVALKQCHDYKQVLENSLSLAALDEGHLLLIECLKIHHYLGAVATLTKKLFKRSEGFKSLRMGGVFYLIRCSPVMAFVAELNHCCQEIPVVVGDRLLYADPISLTISFNCTVVRCSKHLPAMYELTEWTLCASPMLSECDAPKRLDPNGANETSFFPGRLKSPS